VRGERAECLEVAIFDFDVPSLALPRPQKYVARNGEQPPSRIARRLKDVR
jgi:hypothetical protein